MATDIVNNTDDADSPHYCSNSPTHRHRWVGTYNLHGTRGQLCVYCGCGKDIPPVYNLAAHNAMGYALRFTNGRLTHIKAPNGYRGRVKLAEGGRAILFLRGSRRWAGDLLWADRV